MFNEKDNMRMGATPERVFSVCRMVALNNISKDELIRNMTLDKDDSSARGYISASIKLAEEELGILALKNNILTLTIPEYVIESPISFRRYVSSEIFKKKDTTFVIFCKWYITKNETVCVYTSWENMAVDAQNEVKELDVINENSALGWRFWAAFLGLGYLSGTTLIPNMKTRLHDIFATRVLKEQFDKPIRAGEFIDLLRTWLPEVEANSTLPLAVSAGLRTLRELGLIDLETKKDAVRIKLYNVEAEKIQEFSQITIRKDISI